MFLLFTCSSMDQRTKNCGAVPFFVNFSRLHSIMSINRNDRHFSSSNCLILLELHPVLPLKELPAVSLSRWRLPTPRIHLLACGVRALVTLGGITLISAQCAPTSKLSWFSPWFAGFLSLFLAGFCISPAALVSHNQHTLFMLSQWRALYPCHL